MAITMPRERLPRQEQEQLGRGTWGKGKGSWVIIAAINQVGREAYAPNTHRLGLLASAR